MTNKQLKEELGEALELISQLESTLETIWAHKHAIGTAEEKLASVYQLVQPYVRGKDGY